MGQHLTLERHVALAAVVGLVRGPGVARETPKTAGELAGERDLGIGRDRDREVAEQEATMDMDSVLCCNPFLRRNNGKPVCP